MWHVNRNEKNKIVVKIRKNNKRNLLNWHIDNSLWFLVTSIVGWLLVCLSSSLAIAIIVAAYSSFGTLLILRSCIVSREYMTRFLTLCALILCFFLNLSLLISSFSFWKNNLGDLTSSFVSQSGFRLTMEDYGYGMVYVTMFSAILALLGNTEYFKRSSTYITSTLLRIGEINHKYLLLFIIIFSAIHLILLVTGQIKNASFEFGETEVGKLAWWKPIHEAVKTLHVFLNSVLATRIYNSFKKKSLNLFATLLFGFSTFVLFIIFFAEGRREVAYLLFAHAWWFLFFSRIRIQYLKVALVGVIVFPIFSEVSAFYNFLRSAESGLFYSNYKDGNIVKMIPTALEIYAKNSELRNKVADSTSENIASRSLVMIPLSACIALPSAMKSHSGNADLMNSFLWTIPSFFVDKEKYPVQEDLLYSHFPIGDKDTVDSLYMSSYAAYSWFGVILYPLFITFTFGAFVFIARFINMHPLLLAASISSLHHYLLFQFAEASVIDYIGLFTRTIIIYLILSTLISLVYGNINSKSKRQASIVR